MKNHLNKTILICLALIGLASSLKIFAAVISPANAPLTTEMNTNAVHEEIRELARQSFLDSAFSLTTIELKNRPSDSFALFMSAKLNPNGKASAEAFKKTLKSGNEGPEIEESHFRLGQYYYAAGKYSQAIPYFREYLKKFPKGDWMAPALYWIGNASLSYATAKPSYLDSALSYFNLLQKSQKPNDYYYALASEGEAKTLFAKNEKKQALEAGLKAWENAAEEEKSTLLMLLAQINASLDVMEEKKYLEQLVSQYPQSPEARYVKKINAGKETKFWTSSGRSVEKPILTPTVTTNTGAASTPPLEKVESDKKITLQLGAFSQLANAQSLKTELIKLGFSPQLVESQNKGKRLFQIRLGRFETPEAANDFAKKNLRPHQYISQPIPIEP